MYPASEPAPADVARSPRNTLHLQALAGIVIGGVARIAGFSLWKILRLVRDEILLVPGTSSSETALPSLIDEMEKLGCQRGVVGIIVPSGYSFNLDGTCNVYLTMAALFIAQATDTPMRLGAHS